MLTAEGRKKQLILTKRTIIDDLEEIGVLRTSDRYRVQKVELVLDRALLRLVNRILDFEEERHHGIRTVA